MARAHRGLMHGDPARNLPGIESVAEAAYYQAPPHDIDRRMQAYLGDVEAFLRATDAAGRAERAKRIADAARKDLLGALNAVVGFHEDQARGKADRAETVHLWLLVATLATLIGEAVFIFAPLARELANKERAVHAKQDELTYRPFHDQLTGLFNRHCLRAHVATLLDGAGDVIPPLSLIAIDLDNFKDVNDLAGHDAGDRLLRVTADTIRAGIRGDDVAFRLGGDEFLIVVHTPDAGVAENVAERIAIDLQAALAREDGCATVAASFGIASAPAHGTMFEALLANADIALYHAKADGKNTITVFHEPLRAAFEARRREEAFIRAALASSSFEPYFQPQLDMRTGEIVGVEALARCRDANGGLVPPSRFIDLAEETGLIVPLGEQIITKAIETAKSWLDRGIRFGKLSINASSVQLRDKGFVAFLTTTLKETGFPAKRLSVEVLETVLLDEDDKIVGVVDAIRTLGISIELDDFGTGYTSIANVNRLKVERIKIDRSFVDGCDDAAGSKAHVLRAILTMAGALDVDVIAEGIETRGQQESLIALGCPNGQGYKFAEPMRGSDFEAWARRDARRHPVFSAC